MVKILIDEREVIADIKFLLDQLQTIEHMQDAEGIKAMRRKYLGKRWNESNLFRL